MVKINTAKNIASGGTMTMQKWGDPFFFMGCTSSAYRRLDCNPNAPYVAGITIVDINTPTHIYGVLLFHDQF
jgi:hypothetical protein